MPSSSAVRDTLPSWALGLKRNGSYYEGIVKDIDETLLLHKQITVTTYGTRTSESFSGQVWSKRLFLSVMATGLIFNLSDGGK